MSKKLTEEESRQKDKLANVDRPKCYKYLGNDIKHHYICPFCKKIFLWNPIPEIPYYKSEIEAVKPIIINGDLDLIK